MLLVNYKGMEKTKAVLSFTGVKKVRHSAFGKSGSEEVKNSQICS
jgi:hypothetical protein